MLFAPSYNDFKWQLASFGTARPTATAGSAVTPGAAPTMGSWVNLFTSGNMVNDAYGIFISIHSGATTATTRNVLLDIGVDNDGGTAYSVKIPYLLCGHSAPYTVGSGGIWYYFPLFIPAGSSIAARAMGNVTSDIRVHAVVYGQPRRPETVRVGSKVVAFGEDTSTATGQPVTFGTTSEGAWTQLGSATPMPLWWWQTGMTCVDTTMTLAAIHLDVSAGNSSNKRLLLQDILSIVTTSEQISNGPLTLGCAADVAEGDLIYGRGQSSAAADTATSMMAWGLG